MPFLPKNLGDSLWYSAQNAAVISPATVRFPQNTPSRTQSTLSASDLAPKIPRIHPSQPHRGEEYNSLYS